MQDPSKPPSFPNVPKSALFSRLEAFLPMMAEENKRLSEAVAAGEGDKHNIEVEEAEEQSDGHEDNAIAEHGEDKEAHKAPVIEMNFALGTMDENSSDEEDSNAIDPEAQLKVATSANVSSASPGSMQNQKDELAFRMRLERPERKARPVIQELN